jgi:heme a synthase
MIRGKHMKSHDKPVAIWLFTTAAMVFIMIIIGGITRLTESGLSIVNWEPIRGMLPPFGADSWQELFAAYKTSPEFQKLNNWMSLGDFQRIFWWEFIHRFWGRLIGIVFFIPFVWFMIKGRLPKQLMPHMIGVFLLGALQGYIGWYMVQSGLVNDPHVSQYRLTIHLGMALIIIGYLLWLGLKFLKQPTEHFETAPKIRRLALVGLILITTTILSGGFVAGLDAGLIYNTFPMMGDSLIPHEYGALSPFYLNFFENEAAVQFNHRFIAITTFIYVLFFWWHMRKKNVGRTNEKLLTALCHTAILQVTLGITTLLTSVQLHVAVLHQFCALLLFTIILLLIFKQTSENILTEACA